jgi:acetyl-CoA synthetase
MCDAEPPAITPQELVGLGLSGDVAATLANQVNADRCSGSPEGRWRRISQEVLCADYGFPVHRFIYDKVFAGWDESRGPRPMWTPTEAIVRHANVDALRQRLRLSSYGELYAWSIARGDEFWGEVVRTLGIRFEHPPTRVRAPLGDPRSAVWLPGATMNIAESCFQAEDGGPCSRWIGRLGPRHR